MPHWTSVVLVFLGGGAGSLLRYLISWWVPYPGGFPWATFGANMLGCALAGVLSGLWSQPSEGMRLAWLVGFCGGLSTFSAFSKETLQLIQKGAWPMALGYVGISVVAGLLVLWAGYRWTVR